MLDTGIDVPEVLNLVFFKVVRSKTKFWQMIGRGTRKCEDLFGPGDDKTDFRVFDICRNFEFFGEKPEGVEPRVAKPLTRRIFERRLDVVDALAKKDQPKVKESILKLRDKLINDLHKDVSLMNQENVEVRKNLEYVTKYTDKENWKRLSEDDILDLNSHVAGLPTLSPSTHELAKRFDLLCHNLQLYIVEKNIKKINDSAKKIKEICHSLEQKQSIPVVSEKLELIIDIQTDSYWKDINVIVVEELRVSLREIVKFVDRNEQRIVYTDFEDRIEEERDFDFNQILSGTELKQYKAKAESFIRTCKDHITIQKLKSNKPITKLDIEELERLLFTSTEIESKEKFEEVYGEVNLGKFIRGIVGLDRKAAKEAFSFFIKESSLPSEQNQFIDKIIGYLTRYGTMSPKLLYEPPFTNIDDSGIDGVFDDDDADSIVRTIKKINRNAEQLTKTGTMT